MGSLNVWFSTLSSEHLELRSKANLIIGQMKDEEPRVQVEITSTGVQLFITVFGI